MSTEVNVKSFWRAGQPVIEVTVSGRDGGEVLKYGGVRAAGAARYRKNRWSGINGQLYRGKASICPEYSIAEHPILVYRVTYEIH